MNNKVTNVLVFPAGSESALDIYQALRYNVNIDVFGASGKKDNSELVYPDDHFVIDDLYVDKTDFYDKLNSLLEKWSIDIVIPTHDTIAYEFSKNRNKINAKVLTSDEYTAEICRYKLKTLELFKNYDFCPKVYRNSDEIKDSDFPLYIKPDVGAGGKGATIINNRIQFSKMNIDFSNYVVSENLPGDEFTIDCFTSADGQLQFCGMRTRERIQMGIAFRSRSLPMDEYVRQVANEINEKLHFFGAWYFQMKRDINNKLKLLEISCRQPGTMTLYRHKGINFPLLGIYELIGKNSEIIENNFDIMIDRYLKGSFRINFDYDTVYIDFDDTITDKGKVNLNVIAFVYQCQNKNIEVNLLTRHKNEIMKTLSELNIASGLFRNIINVSVDKRKSEYVNKANSIFIDNSFAERKDVFFNCCIPVFDIDVVDMLLN